MRTSGTPTAADPEATPVSVCPGTDGAGEDGRRASAVPASPVPREPRDTKNAVYFILWLLGAGVLFPWNAFISAPDYMTDFPDFVAPNAELSSTERNLWDNILTWFTVSYSTANLAGQLVIVFRGTGVTTLGTRALVPLVLLFTSMLVIPSLSFVKVGTTAAFTTLVLVCGFVGLLSAVLATTVFGIAALFDARFTQAVMLGNGASGLIVSSIRVLTKWSLESDDTSSKRQSGAVYFYLATVWMVLCIFAFLLMRRLRFAQVHVCEFVGVQRWRLGGESEASPESPVATAVSATSTVPCKHAAAPTKDRLSGADGEKKRLISSPQRKRVSTAPVHSRACSVVSACSRRTVSAVSVTGGAAVFRASSPPAGMGAGEGVAELFRAVAPMAFTVWFTLSATIAVFPGVTSDMTSDNIGGGWLPVWLILLYNWTDVLGRSLPKWLPLPPPVVVAGSLVRVVLVPLFVLRTSSGYFSSDAAPFLMITALGVTNGWISSLAMMHGASVQLSSEDLRQRAGAAMSLAMLGGICTGSYIGLALTHYFPSDGSSLSASGG